MAKVSTLNKKLPKASSIRWCTGAGKSMSTSIGTDENRKFSRKICFKQGGSTKSNITWQIVYRWRNRYTPSVSKTKKNATWSSWSKWRTPIAFKPYNEKGVKTAVDKNATVPDYKYWRVGNRGYVKTSSYNVFAHWDTANKQAKTMSADYDAIEYQFAIRSYHAKTAKHGEWVYQKLKVYRRATIADEVLVKTPNGLSLEFNYISERGGSVVIDSIVKGSGSLSYSIIDKPINVAPATDTLRASSGDVSWYPYKRAGYTAGQVSITNIWRPIEFGDKVTFNGYYKTKDGAKTKFVLKNNGYIYGEDTTLPKPTLSTSVNKDTGVVTVTARRTTAFDGENFSIKKIGCSGSYELNGVKKTCEPFYDDFDTGIHTDADILGTWKFRPPTNVDVTYKVSVTNEWNRSNWASIVEKVEGAGYLLNGITYPNVYAAVSYNTQFNLSTEKDVVISLPHGRSLPFAVYGTGRTPTMTLQGYAIENEKKINKYSTPYYIKRLSQYLGVYLLRNSQGEIFKVALKKVDIQYVRSDLISVTIEMQEVS